MKRWKSAGLIGRFRPLHKGAASMLEFACEQAGHVVIGIGSSNRNDVRNPFTYEEVEQMIHAYMKDRHDNYSIVPVRDFGPEEGCFDDNRWIEEVKDTIANVEVILTGNPYVQATLENHYTIADPFESIPLERQFPTEGTRVRMRMAGEWRWENDVPEEVVQYIKENRLDERFRNEHGAETLRRNHHMNRTLETEREAVMGVNAR